MRSAIGVFIVFFLLGLAVMAPAIGVVHFGLSEEVLGPVSVILVFLACGVPGGDE